MKIATQNTNYSHSAVAILSSILSWSSIVRCVKKSIPVSASIFLIVVNA